jgi:hypothetical protein
MPLGPETGYVEVFRGFTQSIDVCYADALFYLRDELNI